MVGRDRVQGPTFEGHQSWPPPTESAKGRSRPKIMALVAGLLVLVAVTSFAAWQGVGLAMDRGRTEVPAGAQAAHQASAQSAADRDAAAAADDRKAAMAAGAATAVKLTSVGWQTIDADIKGILAMSTGTFHDDFAQRSQSFADVVRNVKSVSTGTVNQSAVQSIGAGTASVLVAITVETSNDGAKQPPRSWRMRIALARQGDAYLASNVEFVP